MSYELPINAYPIMQLWSLIIGLRGKVFKPLNVQKLVRTDEQTNTNTCSVATLFKTEFCTCTYHINACPKLGVQFLRERDALSNCFSNVTDRQTDPSYWIAALLTRVWRFLRGICALKKNQVERGYWAVYYTSPQSFKKKISYSYLWNFDWLVL